MVSVIIPWRPQPSRIAAFERVTAWYRDAIPEAHLVTVDSGDDPFNLARCRNLGVAGVEDPDDVVVIGDADTLPELAPLREAIHAARSSGLVHLPYTRYHWLGAEGTAAFAAGMPLEDAPYDLVVGACSGVYVTTPHTWRRHGGQDERFRGWGFEDAAWYVAHETLLGAPPQRHEGRVFALHHQPEQRSGPQYDANAALMERYRVASSDVDAMAELVSADADAVNASSGPGV